MQLLNHRHHQANRGQTRNRRGTLNNAHRSGQNEAGQRNRQAHPGQGFTQCRADAGIHQHLFEHAARTDNQQNNPRWLQGRATDRHHFVFCHALTERQAINRHQAGNQNRGEWVTDKFKPLIGFGLHRHKARGDRFQTHQHQRQQNQRQAEAEGRHFAFAEVRLGNVIRNIQLNVTADKIAPQRPGNNHPRNRRTQANQNHPAKVGVHLGSQQHWRWPRQQKRSSGGYTGKQRNHQLHQVGPGVTRHRERDANQQHNRHFKEQRQRTDKTGDTNGIVRAAVAEGFQHFDRNLIDCARLMQNFAEHRAQRDHDSQEAQRTAHAFLHGFRDFNQRHTGEKPCTNRNHHQSQEGVHTRLHD